MKLLRTLPFALALLTGCMDNPAEPNAAAPVPAIQASYTLYSNKAQEYYYASGIDPLGYKVIGYAVEYGGAQVPATWMFQASDILLGVGQYTVSGFSYYDRFYINNNSSIVAVTIYNNFGCEADYWRPNPDSTSSGRHVLPAPPGAPCLIVRGVSDGPAFTIIGYTTSEKAYRYDVTADDQVTVTALQPPAAASGANCQFRATALNGAADKIVGFYRTPCDGYPDQSHAVSWNLSNSVLTDWNVRGEPTALNASGVVVGNDETDLSKGFTSSGPSTSGMT